MGASRKAKSENRNMLYNSYPGNRGSSGTRRILVETIVASDPFALTVPTPVRDVFM